MIKAVIFDCYGVLISADWQKMRNGSMLDKVLSLRKEYKTALLSNISAESLERLFSADEQEALFDICVATAEEVATKPDPLIFKITAERLGVSPEECLFVDDATENVEGARLVGMKGLHYHSAEQFISDLETVLAADAE